MTLRKFVDAGVLLAIGFLVGMMVADISSIEHFVSEWQTLTAGILAVIAAAWTVREMRRNDGAQQVRHDQLMNLNLRADRLKARRAAFPYALHISTAAEVLAEYSAEKFDNLNNNEVVSAVAVMRQCWFQMNEVLNEKPIVEASTLFDSNMAHTYRLAISDLQRAKGNDPVIEHFARVGSVAEQNRAKIVNFYKGMSLYSRTLQSFSDQLVQLADHYGEE